MLIRSLLPNAFQLNLAISHAHIIARGFSCSRAGENLAITHTEARAVPGTLHINTCSLFKLLENQAGIMTTKAYRI